MTWRPRGPVRTIADGGWGGGAQNIPPLSIVQGFMGPPKSSRGGGSPPQQKICNRGGGSAAPSLHSFPYILPSPTFVHGKSCGCEVAAMSVWHP